MSLLQEKFSSSCAAVLRKKCRRSQSCTINSKKSCSAKGPNGLSAITKPETSGFAKHLLSESNSAYTKSDKNGKVDNIASLKSKVQSRFTYQIKINSDKDTCRKKHKPEEDLVNSIRKKPNGNSCANSVTKRKTSSLKRELEREVARLATQKIEKTVDIYDYCHYLKDLETFGSLCSTFDKSFDCGLRLDEINGRELLEQLGLYLKMEDEEEIDQHRFDDREVKIF